MIRNPLFLACCCLLSALFFGTRAEALTCCNPHTSICLAVFDPNCELPICDPYPAIDVSINDPAPYALNCHASSTSMSIGMGSLTIGTGTLTIR